MKSINDETEKRIKAFSVYEPDFEVISEEDDLILGFWKQGRGAIRIRKGPGGYDPKKREPIGEEHFQRILEIVLPQSKRRIL